MKKSLLALAVLGAFAGVAQAQTSVTMYGEIDLGLYKNTGKTTAMSNGDNSRLGFKGTEDLGGGLAAIFKAEIRFDADTGTTEGGGTRPLFQGRSYVGLTGGFGTVRLGRDLTAYQSESGNFDAWGALRARPGFDPFQDGNYVSVTNNGSGNRFSNAVMYNTPAMGGFSVGVTVAAKESSDLSGAVAATATKPAISAEAPTDTPVSLALAYHNGPIGAMLGYERNEIGRKIEKIAGSYDFGAASLIGTYAKDCSGGPGSALTAPAVIPKTCDLDTKTWTISSAIPFGAEKVLVGYGVVKYDPTDAKTKQASLGFQHTLSKRTYLYADYSNTKTSVSTNQVDVGINHTF